MDEFHTRFWVGYPAPAGDQDLLVQLLPFSTISFHLAGELTYELPRLEESLVKLAEATSRGEFPRLEEVRLDNNKRLEDRDRVRALFEAAEVSFAYRGWELSRSTMGGRRSPPFPNFWDDPYGLPDMDDPDL